MSIGVFINHTIAFMTSPLAVSLALIVFGLTLCVVNSRRKDPSRFSFLISHFSLLIGVFYLWFMSTGLAYRWLGLGLEREFPPVPVEELPQADAIAVLGGGIGSCTNVTCYPELYMSADRVTHAARIWKAGKAPVIIPSGKGGVNAALPYLKELGVPETAVLVENESGNTEENARSVKREVERLGGGGERKVILVTSAWHMRRSLLMFRKYAPGIDIIPAACDYEAMVHMDAWNFFGDLIPNADSLLRNSYMLKEYIGYWGYRILR